MNTLTMQIVHKAQLDGNRVFIAEDGKGDYGIFTNQDESAVVSFWPAPFGGMNFATCHKALHNTNVGQGELIAEDRYNMENLDTNAYLRRNVATPDHRPKTLTEHLEFYKSSNYKELK